MTDFQAQTWDDESPNAFKATQNEPTSKESTQEPDAHMSQIDAMLAWEDGNISEDEAIHLFQGLVDSGLAWQLQGMYGRQAMRFIDAGLIQPRRVPAITTALKSAVMGDFD